jgi:putative ABC transport system ATP-binding protein
VEAVASAVAASVLQPSDDLIRIESVTKIYGTGDAAVAALRNFSLTVSVGDSIAVMGPSGSGKSTLMNILGCLDTPSSGRYPAVSATAEALGVEERRAAAALQKRE